MRAENCPEYSVVPINKEQSYPSPDEYVPSTPRACCQTGTSEYSAQRRSKGRIANRFLPH
jgi:hypothetical protein